MTPQSQGNSLSRRQVAKGAAWAAPAVSLAAAAPASASSNGCTAANATDGGEIVALLGLADAFNGDYSSFTYLNNAEPLPGFPDAPAIPVGTTFTVTLTWLVASEDTPLPKFDSRKLKAAMATVGDRSIEAVDGFFKLSTVVTFVTVAPLSPSVEVEGSDDELTNGGSMTWGAVETADSSDPEGELELVSAPVSEQLDTKNCVNYKVGVKLQEPRG